MLKWIWNNLEEAGAACLLAIMATIAFVNVITRYVVSFSMAFTEELTVYLFVWATLLGTALAFKNGSNMVVTVLYNRFPKGGRRILYIMSSVFAFSFFALLGYYGYLQVRDEYTLQVHTESMHMPLWYFSASLPVGAAIIMLRILCKTRADLRSGNY